MRWRRTVGPRLRKLIPCGYCFEEWADCYDHINPVCNGGTSRKSNLYPACARCNALAGGLVFGSLDEKRDYVRERLKEREEWHSAKEMRKLREALPASATSMAEILFRSMPIEKVAKAKRRKKRIRSHIRCVVCGEFCPKHRWVCSKECRLIQSINEGIEEMELKLRNKLEALAGLPLTKPTGSRNSNLNFKMPQAQIPFKVKAVKWTPSSKGLEVELDTGKKLYCFDNKRMGEDREELFNILLVSPGKECIFLTKQTKAKDNREFTNIVGLLKMGEREWGEDGVPILRREPATSRTERREPGEDSEEEWLK